MLNFQQPYAFVKGEVSRALSEHDVSVHRVDPNQWSAPSKLLPHPDIAARCAVAVVPLVGFGDVHGPVADDPCLAAEIIGIGGSELHVRGQVARCSDRDAAASRSHHY